MSAHQHQPPQFESVMQDYGGLLSRVASTYEANQSLQQELYQEICMAVWQALKQFKGEASVKTYVLRIAHNKCVTHVSKEVKALKTETYCEVENSQPLNTDNSNNAPIKTGLLSPENEVMQIKQLSRLMLAIRELKLPARQIIALSLEGLSYDEIAQVTGLKLSNIGVIINRTKKELQRKMQNEN